MARCDRCDREDELNFLKFASKEKETETWLCKHCMELARATWGSFFRKRGERLTDDDIMPMSKEHRGKRLGDVPDSFWEWFLKQSWCDNWPTLVEYANTGVEE